MRALLTRARDTFAAVLDPFTDSIVLVGPGGDLRRPVAGPECAPDCDDETMCQNDQQYTRSCCMTQTCALVCSDWTLTGVSC